MSKRKESVVDEKEEVRRPSDCRVMLTWLAREETTVDISDNHNRSQPAMVARKQS